MESHISFIVVSDRLSDFYVRARSLSWYFNRFTRLFSSFSFLLFLIRATHSFVKESWNENSRSFSSSFLELGKKKRGKKNCNLRVPLAERIPSFRETRGNFPRFRFFTRGNVKRKREDSGVFRSLIKSIIRGQM